MRDFLKGNHAAAYGARLARPQVIAAYPITPQSPIYEKLFGYADHLQGDIDRPLVRILLGGDVEPEE